MSLEQLVTMEIYVIETAGMPHLYVWATSIKKAHAFGRKTYPGKSIATRKTKPTEWGLIDEKNIFNAG
jgi:hypothetical protein